MFLVSDCPFSMSTSNKSSKPKLSIYVLQWPEENLYVLKFKILCDSDFSYINLYITGNL